MRVNWEQVNLEVASGEHDHNGLDELLPAKFLWHQVANTWVSLCESSSLEHNNDVDENKDEGCSKQ